MTEYNLPEQTQLQQASARPVSGDELETFGKHAAALFCAGSAGSMTEAVVDTIKKAGLSPEQVKRVVEFANTAAFVHEFRKEGAATKYVHFEHGPADPGEVLKDLNDGGGGTVFDRGTLDYSHSPDVHKHASAGGIYDRNRSAMEKTAGVMGSGDALLAAAFGVQESVTPYSNPLQEVEDARAKLAAVRDAALSEMSEIEVALLDVNRDLYNHVKQAAMDGVPLGHVVQAWHQVLHPDPELVKAAFAMIGPRLREEEVLTYEQIGDSITKTAGARLVNDQHPIVRSFGAYCEAIEKIAGMRAVYEECTDGIAQLDKFHKLASDRLVQERMVADAREKRAQEERRQQAFITYEPQAREVV